jgi:predicted outer membrane protein
MASARIEARYESCSDLLAGKYTFNPGSLFLGGVYPMRRKYSLAVAILCGLAFSLAADITNAQLIRRRVVPAQPATPIVQNESFAGQHDIFLAKWIESDNQIEILLNQFAEQRLSNPEIKTFTQQMVREHSDLATKLNQVVANLNAASASTSGQVPYTAGYRGEQGAAPAAGQPVAPAVGPGQPGAATTAGQPVPATDPRQPQPTAPITSSPPAAISPAPGNNNPAATVPAPGNAAAAVSTAGMNREAAGGMQHMNAANFERQIDDQLVVLVEQKLGQKKGEEFDRCFLQGQIIGHVRMMATLEAARNQASPQLKPVLEEALGVAQKHLSEAESLLNKLPPQQARSS